MASSEYVILQGLPSAQVYHDLRKTANLTPPPLEALAEVVPNSLQKSFACFLAYEGKHMVSDTTPGPNQEPVGMGRLIGDELFLMLVDVAVHPSHQRKGIGKQIMDSLVKFADDKAPHAYVSLVADPMGAKLYPKHGFEDVKPSIGMFRCNRIQNNRAAAKAREERYMAAMEGTR